jgi:anti-repressor protein
MDFFKFEGVDFTVLKTPKDDTWWVGKEVCEYLEYPNRSTAMQIVPEEEKKVTVIEDLRSHGRGGDNGRRVIISEAGLYRLIARSNKPEALKFQDWIFNEVIPSIRKTGSYSVQPKIEDSKQQIPRGPKNYKEAVQHILVQIEANERLTAEKHALTVQNQNLKPQAIALQRLVKSTGLVRITDVGKIIGVPPKKFSRELVEKKYCYKSRGKLIPYQKYIDAGWMEVKLVKARDDVGHSYRQTFITPKGVVRFQEIFNPIPPGKQRRLFA